MIGESELILNPRGSVYHLDLMPEEIADTIITVGDPDRVPAISKYFDSIELRRQRREFVTHTGNLAGKRLTVISTGIGTDNIDIVLSELDALINIDLIKRRALHHLRRLKIIRIGTSGSMRREIGVDSFLVSEMALGIDNMLNFYRLPYTDDERILLHAFVNHVQKDHIGFIPYLASCASSMFSIFRDHMASGITVTCPGFYGPQGRKIRASLAYPGLLDLLSSFRHEKYLLTNFEMETSGIYGMARVLGHDAISLSAIVANRIEKKFSTNPEELVDKLIRMALDVIVTL
ncbi:MAG: nucleoside phosphorylase [Chitinophagales bacterium]